MFVIFIELTKSVNLNAYHIGHGNSNASFPKSVEKYRYNEYIALGMTNAGNDTRTKK